jgi:hypothetical protein
VVVGKSIETTPLPFVDVVLVPTTAFELLIRSTFTDTAGEGAPPHDVALTDPVMSVPTGTDGVTDWKASWLFGSTLVAVENVSWNVSPENEEPVHAMLLAQVVCAHPACDVLTFSDAWNVKDACGLSGDMFEKAITPLCVMSTIAWYVFVTELTV